MIKNFILGIIAFVLVFVTVNFAQAASTNTSAPKALGPHWAKYPIKVYIPKDDKQPAMKNAFTEWQSQSSGKVKFTFVQQEDKADLIVKFTDKTTGLESKLGGNKITKKEGNQIKKAEITLATKSPAAKKHTNKYVYLTMLHQIGHILGLPDNPTKPTSIMHMPISEDQSIKKIDIRKLYKVNGWSYADRNMPSQRN